MLPRNALPPLLMKRTFGREKKPDTAGVQTSELTKCLALDDRENENFSFAGHTFLFLIGSGLEKIPCYPRRGFFFFSSRLAYPSFFRKVFVKMLLCIIAVAIGLKKKNPL